MLYFAIHHCLLWMQTIRIQKFLAVLKESKMNPSDCLSRNCLYYRYLVFVSASNRSLNRLNLWLLFFRWFPHGKSAACKKLPDQITQTSVVYSLTFVYLVYFILYSTWGTPRQLKILMCENEQKPELDPWKKRAPEQEPCLWREEFRSRSCVIFTTAPQAWL